MAVKKIGELLVESGLITDEQLNETLAESKDKGVRIGTLLVKKGYASEIDIAQTLSFQLNIPFMDVANSSVDPEALKLVNERLAKKFQIVPIHIDRKVLKLAMADPLNLAAIDDVRFSAGMEVQPCVATISDVNAAIDRFYHLNESAPLDEIMVDLKKDKLVEVIREADSGRDLSEHVKKSSAPPIIKMVDSIIIHGVDSRASDIHIEPQEKSVKLRVRVDGLMRETMQIPKWVQGPVVSRIKLMANMDIAERRVSQDGRIKVRLGDKNLDLRVSTLPTQYGETVVIRILDPRGSLIDLNKIGLLDKDLKTINNLIRRPQGILLVTGPTGSGKTSTLYSMIGRIKSEEINIITIEDPIEYELKGVSQVPVNEKTGLTFAYTLRSVLRQDPDVILVGEMRDAETASIAHQASMTGHMVFSTLHTNDAVSSIVRLRNIGVPSYMIASALNGVVAQRLVRKICYGCREEYAPDASVLKKAGLSPGAKLFRGAGCKDCNNTGFAGRAGIFEVLAVTPGIKRLIAAEAAEQEILKAAVEGGMVPMHKDGLKKVVSGMTTIEELDRVIYLSEDHEWQDVCPGCGGHIARGVDACPHCSIALARECHKCGKKRQQEWIVCPFCAARFNEGELRLEVG